jgi:Mg2+ and Co2+ transporter CorA
MVEGMKSIAEENAKMTLRMKELAETSYRQAEESSRQADAMARLAYDSKRDSEVMKTITVVTMIFLPGTFCCVCSILTTPLALELVLT